MSSTMAVTIAVVAPSSSSGRRLRFASEGEAISIVELAMELGAAVEHQAGSSEGIMVWAGWSAARCYASSLAPLLPTLTIHARCGRGSPFQTGAAAMVVALTSVIP